MIRTVALGDVIRLAKVKRAGGGSYPLLSMTMHSGLMDQSAKFKKRVASSDISDYKIIKRGQLVVGFPIDEGVLDFQMLYDEGIVSPAYGVWDLVSEDCIYRPYLNKFLRSGPALAYYKGRLRGSTARRRSLPAEVFLALRVPLPPVDEQRRIAAILDHAGALRNKRREVLAHLDTLTQSIFHDMFANCRDNVTLGELGVWRSGGTPPRGVKKHFSGNIPWFSSGELGRQLVFDSAEHVSFEAIAETAVKPIPIGSILLGMYDTAALKSSITALEATCNQAIAFSTIDESTADTVYVYWAIQAGKERVLSLRRGIRQKNLNLSIVREIRIPQAELSLQRLFANRAAKVMNQRTICQRELVAHDELSGSLQHHAFRGEL